MKRDFKKKGKREKKQWKKKKEGMKDKNEETWGRGVQEKCHFKRNRGKIEKIMKKKTERNNNQ